MRICTSCCSKQSTQIACSCELYKKDPKEDSCERCGKSGVTYNCKFPPKSLLQMQEEQAKAIGNCSYLELSGIQRLAVDDIISAELGEIPKCQQ